MNTSPVTNPKVQFTLTIKPLTVAETVNQHHRSSPRKLTNYHVINH